MNLMLGTITSNHTDPARLTDATCHRPVVVVRPPYDQGYLLEDFEDACAQALSQVLPSRYLSWLASLVVQSVPYYALPTRKRSGEDGRVGLLDAGADEGSIAARARPSSPLSVAWVLRWPSPPPQHSESTQE